MNARARLERRWLGLPPARSALLESRPWMRSDDGVRLAARVWRPTDARVRRGTVLIRSERPLGDHRASSPVEKLGRWLAEDGCTVVIQSCRGRGASEGDFRPFADEVADGRRAVRWVGDELGFDGELVLLGLGYSAFTAWAALSAAPERVAAMVVGFGARDPYAWLYPGGVLQLEAALALAARLDGRSGFDSSAIDLERAARHRPLCECDRVALRELAAFREWIAHPECDEWWQARTPTLPDVLPPTLFAAGWYECALTAAYADFETARRRAAARDLAPPALVLGPWGAAPLPRTERARGANEIGAVARAALGFVASTVGANPARDGGTFPGSARVFVRGAGWRVAGPWPPEAVSDRTLYLRGSGRANSADGDGRLAPEPPGVEDADTFVADPADPVPSLGGAAVGRIAGAVDQRTVERRADVLCFTSAPLPEALELLGRVKVVLYTGGDSALADTNAKLVAVDPSGSAHWLCEGIARTAARTEQSALEIDLGVAGARLGAGARLRLEIAGSSVPRFARPEQSADPAPRVRIVHHDRERPSALRFQARTGSSAGTRNEPGPPAARRRARLESSRPSV